MLDRSLTLSWLSLMCSSLMTRTAVTLSATLLLSSSNSLSCLSTILPENIPKQLTLFLQMFPIIQRVPKRRSGKIPFFFEEKEKMFDQNLQESEKFQEVQKIHFFFRSRLVFTHSCLISSCFFSLFERSNSFVSATFSFFSRFSCFFFVVSFFFSWQLFKNIFCFLFRLLLFSIFFFFSFSFSPKTIILLVSNNIKINVYMSNSFFAALFDLNFLSPLFFVFTLCLSLFSFLVFGT